MLANIRFSAGLALAAIIGTPAGEAQPLLGHVEQHTFLGPITNQQIVFNVYLPPGYEANAGAYPVVYHLHGLGGSHGGNQIATVPAEFEAAHLAGLIGPVIIVFPNGYTNAFWADSIDGTKPAETNVVAELLPYVDANFRTRASANSRVIEGFSMGGFGAAKFQAKFPDLFACGVIYDGALLTWERMVQFQPAIASEIFGNNEAYFDQYSPWWWTTQNATPLIAQDPFRSVVGQLTLANREFRDHLLALDIPIDYVETGCDHVLSCVLDTQGAQSIAFVAQRIGSGVLGDADADGDVDQADLGLVLADFGCESFCPTDLNGDGAVTQADLGVLLANFGQ